MTPPSSSGDEDLVNASLAGNREAFTQIVARHQSLICSLAFSATGSLPQSEDLAQETFIAAWKHLPELREPSKLRSWLCGIARNLINNFLRTAGREPSHRAAALEDVAEARSPEPWPRDRAMDREEAEILWRALERIPETYREPLVLFYREHQSVSAVAQELELTEEAVRQRLARGRKLLQEEVLAFVEGALERTAPGMAFTLAVVAALPLAVTSAKAASVGVAVAKGGAGAKGALSLGALGSLAAMFGAVLFSWKNAVDETKSPPERRLIVRTAWFQITFFVLSMAAIFYSLPRLSQHPLVLGLVSAVIIVANIVNGTMMADRLRQQVAIRMEEGTWADAEWTGPGKEADRKAFWKTAKQMIPFLLLFGFGSLGLPWKQHGTRCAAITAGELMIMIWAFRRFYQMHSFRAVPGLKSPKLQAIFQRPIIFMPAVVFGSALLGIGLVCYLQPGSAEFLMHHGPWLRSMGFCLLAVAVGYVLFVVIYVKKHPAAPEGEGASDGTNHMAGAILGNPFFRRTLALTNRMMAPMMDKMLLNHYAPVFPQIHPDQAQLAQLRDLILKKNAVNMDKGLALMDRKLEAPRRAALIEEMKNGREACDAEIRQLLGEEDYRVFEQFEKSLPDRLILGLFKSKAARMGAPLTEQQQEQLLHVVSAARALYNWSTDLSRRVQNPTDLGATFSEENISTFAREEQEFDRQFVAEATPLLTAAQLAALEPFLAVQRQAKVSAMKMTAKMFAPGGS